MYLDQAFFFPLEAAIRVIIERIVPGIQKKDLVEQIYTMLREQPPEG